MIKTSSDTHHFKVFASIFINEISVILDKHRSKHYYLHNNDEKDKTFIRMTFLRVMFAPLFPHSVATSTEIDQFNVCSQAFRHVHSTVGSEWCFGEDVHFGLSLCNNSLFYTQILIMNSVQEYM